MLPRTHCVTDLRMTGPRTLDLLETVCREGVDAIQVRAKHLTDRELLALTRAVIDAVRPLGASVLVNDRLDIALAAGSDGVHLGIDDLPVERARELAPAGFVIGATCRSAADALRAREAGADYAGVGPVHPSTSKAGLPGPIGLRTLAECAPVLPVIAIGGIDTGRVPDVMAAGAHGVAVVAALSRADDPGRAARALVAAVVGAPAIS